MTEHVQIAPRSHEMKQLWPEQTAEHKRESIKFRPQPCMFGVGLNP